MTKTGKRESPGFVSRFLKWKTNRRLRFCIQVLEHTKKRDGTPQWAYKRGGDSDSRLKEKSGFCIQVFVRSASEAGAGGDYKHQTEQEKKTDLGVSA